MSERARFRFLREEGTGGLGRGYMVGRDEVAAPWLGYARVLLRHDERATQHITRAQRALKGAPLNLIRHHGLFNPEDADSREVDAPFVVMDYLDCAPLPDVQRPGGWSPDAAAALIHQAASGLGWAASEGLLHHWLTPWKLLLTPLGVVKVSGVETPWAPSSGSSW